MVLWVLYRESNSKDIFVHSHACMNVCMQFLLPVSNHLLRGWRNVMWNKTRVILKPAELQALGSDGPTATCDLKTNISGTNLPKWPDFSPNHCFHNGEPSALWMDIPVLLSQELHFTGYVVLHQIILREAMDCIPDHCEWEISMEVQPQTRTRPSSFCLLQQKEGNHEIEEEKY